MKFVLLGIVILIFLALTVIGTAYSILKSWSNHG